MTWRCSSSCLRVIELPTSILLADERDSIWGDCASCDVVLRSSHGRFDGSFPSGDGTAGGDFRAPFSKPESLLGDLDGDGDVDIDDFAVFAACMSGPEVSYQGGCDEADFNGSGP